MKYSYFLILLFSQYLVACQSKTGDKRPEKVPAKKVAIAPTGPDSVQFACAKVKQAGILLPDTSYRIALEHRLGNALFIYDSLHAPQQMVPVQMNGFVATVYRAYADHRPLRLSPDDIWLLIAQGISIHVNENHDRLKKVLFTHDRPADIIVRNDDLVNKTPESWTALTNSFSKEIAAYTKADMKDLLVPEFTTTMPAHTTVYEITVLETVKKSFAFFGASGCGIPQITLTGTRQDWESIYSRLDKLKIFGLDEWLDNLKPILREFINAYDGKINLDFWNGIYKEESYYMVHNISGWMIKFFPYIKKYVMQKEWDPNADGLRGDEIYEPNPYYTGETYLLSNLETGNFPSGIASVSMVWEIFYKDGKKESRNMLLKGGFVGIRQNRKTGELSPEINWAVCSPGLPPSYDLQYAAPYDEAEAKTHAEQRWSVTVKDSVPVLPVYDSLANKTYAKGIAAFKKELLVALGKHKDLQPLLQKGIELSFIVTHNGTIAKIEMDKSIAAGQRKLILQELLTMRKWSPSYSELGNEPGAPGGMIKVNYPVKLQLGK